VIHVRTGDLLKSDAHALVNTVNRVGVMGKGVALQFKKRYPEMYDDYVRRCERGEVQLGKPYPYEATDGHLIINFPTKDHWRGVSNLSAIITGLRYLSRHYAEWGIRSIAVPPLGCGNGQLDWAVVGPTLFRELRKMPIEVTLYAPLGTPTNQMQLDFFTDPAIQLPQVTGNPETTIEPSWVAIADVVARIYAHQNHWPVGRVRFQKIAYFLSALGVPTQLDHVRNSYGPFAPNLKAIEARLMNNGLLTEQRLGRMIEIGVGPTFEDARGAYRAELDKWAPEIDRVVDLFARMQTKQTETAASIHLVAKELSEQLCRRATEVEVRDEVMRWKRNHRPPLDPVEVERTIEDLSVLGWIDIEPSPELRGEDFELHAAAGAAG